MPSSTFKLTLSHCEYLLSILRYADICSYEINPDLAKTPKKARSNRIYRPKYPRKPKRTWSNILRNFKKACE
ncbi:hypothetical protein WA026_011503 [Henosepilachna vigintioctopunctata]|uniref:Uncharacterized protein n=1 Tax=Henosepilachna vigintioctopunctata TaxID=420089 RepID=A0AAW1TVP1_9CUCU